MWLARVGAVGALLVLLTACGPDSSTSARMLRVSFRKASALHYRYEATTSSGAVSQGDVSGGEDATWRVIAVDPAGAATIDQTLSGGGMWQFTVAPDGLVTAVPPAGTMSVPGSSQFLAILSHRPVRPGQGWTADVRLAGPDGSPPATLHARSGLSRYESWHGAQVAVVTSRGTGPFDLRAGAVSYSGTVDCDSTTWLDPASGRLVRVDSTVTADVVASTGEHTAITYRLRLESTDPA
jgi:hypothetical protein